MCNSTGGHEGGSAACGIEDAHGQIPWPPDGILARAGTTKMLEGIGDRVHITGIVCVWHSCGVMKMLRGWKFGSADCRRGVPGVPRDAK